MVTFNIEYKDVRGTCKDDEIQAEAGTNFEEMIGDDRAHIQVVQQACQYGAILCTHNLGRAIEVNLYDPNEPNVWDEVTYFDTLNGYQLHKLSTSGSKAASTAAPTTMSSQASS